MTWPVYPHPDRHPALDSFRDEAPKGSRTYEYWVAADVWRGQHNHLYRSYSLEDSEDVRDYTERLHGDPNDDGRESFWALPGCVRSDQYPIPKQSALRYVGTPQRVHNLACTLLAIGQLPGDPDIDGKVMVTNSITQMVARATGEVACFWTHDSEREVYVRIVIVRHPSGTHVPEGEAAPIRTYWKATLEPRDVRAGTGAVALVCQTITFSVPREMKHKTLVTEAKTLLAIKPYPVMRTGEETWNLIAAPYTMKLESIDDPTSRE